MNTANRIRMSYPMPIAKLYEAMYLENDPRQRVRKLVDLFEGTVHYLVLVGLSSYIYHELSDAKVEKFRCELERPTLGSWLQLLKVLDAALRSGSNTPLLVNPQQIHKDDSVSRAQLELAGLIGTDQPKKVKLGHFLDSMVQFRNEKIGHGSLSRPEAKHVLSPLESAISQLLSETEILSHQHLVYVERIEWDGQHFMNYGKNLNYGTSLSPLGLKRDTPVTPEQVYLHQPGRDYLIPIYPFMIFDNDTHLLYSYSRISSKRDLVLQCPYHASGADPARYLNYDESIIMGAGSTDRIVSSGDNQKRTQGATVSEYTTIVELMREKSSEAWLTDSQREVWTQLHKFMEPPYYVVNIYGATGAGKTFLGWLLQKAGPAVHIEANALSWQSLQDHSLVVLDGYDSSRRSVRSLRSQLQLQNIGQAIIITRQKAQDDIPCLHLGVTERDVQIVRATLYRELEMIIPEGNYRNLWDCFTHLEE